MRYASAIGQTRTAGLRKFLPAVILETWWPGGRRSPQHPRSNVPWRAQVWRRAGSGAIQPRWAQALGARAHLSVPHRRLQTNPKAAEMLTNPKTVDQTSQGRSEPCDRARHKRSGAAARSERAGPPGKPDKPETRGKADDSEDSWGRAGGACRFVRGGQGRRVARVLRARDHRAAAGAENRRSGGACGS
jgi:hypothetical protein